MRNWETEIRLKKQELDKYLDRITVVTFELERLMFQRDMAIVLRHVNLKGGDIWD